MPTRTVVRINEDRCIGCGKCAAVCHQSAIVMENGKAKVLEYSCDGLGRCLPSCPADAIYTETIEDTREVPSESSGTSLNHWPLQIQLVRADAPFLRGADILIAADCTAFALPGFRSKYMRGKVTLIGCPKLDDYDYADKIAQILANGARSVTVARMEVPCCIGLESAVRSAVDICGCGLKPEVVVISTDGRIL